MLLKCETSMLLFVLSWMIRSYDSRSDVASESRPNQVTGVTLAHGSFEITMCRVSAWSGSIIYMESPLPEEARSDVFLWSMLCHLLASTPRSEFSGSCCCYIREGDVAPLFWRLRMIAVQGLPKEEWNMGMVVTLLMACTPFWDGTGYVTCSAQTDFCLQYIFLWINVIIWGASRK